jgi:hypothetical protein
MTNDPYLHSLEVEVEADIELNAAGTVPVDELESPSEWLLDPVEAQVEAVELQSLRGAIEALEGNPHQGPGLSSS